jgi:hypothetical protein
MLTPALFLSLAVQQIRPFMWIVVIGIRQKELPV